jgi:hypothetical protein
MQVARRPSHQAYRNSEPLPAAADGGSSHLGEPSIFEPAKFAAAAAIRRTVELRCRRYFYARRGLGDAIISARLASNFICTRGQTGCLY